MTRRCTKCGVDYPATTDYFYKRSATALCTRCKACMKAAAHVYRVNHRTQLRDYAQRWNRERKAQRFERVIYEVIG